MLKGYHSLATFATVAFLTLASCDTGGTVVVTGSGGSGGAPVMSCQYKAGCDDAGNRLDGGPIVLGTGGAK
jgi:hypothetical protein